VALKEYVDAYIREDIWIDFAVFYDRGDNDMERNKKVAIIGSNGLPPKYGGFETLVHYLTLNLSSKVTS
jgi:FMN-dependent NADH-azoreductase